MKTSIIAEVGVNHNGSIKRAIKMIKIAKDCGADYVKFQTAVVDQVMIKKAPKAIYQIKNTKKRNENQYEMSKRIHLKLEDYKTLFKECKKNKIKFLSSPFDLKSIKALLKLKIRIFKIPSGEITNLPYLIEISKNAHEVILSTGMSNLKEIKKAVEILKKYGNLNKKITIMHCNTDYPTSFNDVNLKAMKNLEKEIGVEIGYSDHTVGIEVPIAAVALGANIIEKHFTINNKLNGPDHACSLMPIELKKMCQSIRNIEKALGSSIKEPTKNELKNINIVRKSIVASKYIKKGELFTTNNITTKRPGYGISPMKWFEVIGKKAKQNYKIDEFIKK